MDYGQTNQTDVNSADFFTAGAGTQNELVNNVNPENNFDLSNNATSWSVANTRFKSRNFGQNAIMGEVMQTSGDFSDSSNRGNLANPGATETVAEFGTSTPEAGPDFGMPTPELGQITNLEQPSSKPDNTPSGDFDYDSSVIRVEGDTLSPKAIEPIIKNEKALHRDKDAASFVENFELFKVDNLKNSYNRELGGQ